MLQSGRWDQHAHIQVFVMTAAQNLHKNITGAAIPNLYTYTIVVKRWIHDSELKLLQGCQFKPLAVFHAESLFLFFVVFFITRRGILTPLVRGFSIEVAYYVCG